MVGNPVPVMVAVLFSVTLPGHADALAPPVTVVATVTERAWPLARSPNGQLRLLLAIVQPPGFVVIAQMFRLPKVGSGSFSTTLWAVPGPVLATTIVNAMLSPMLY